MELGEKILAARQEAGLSQRQVCGDVITRNMLSRIEHGAARPSMKTLQYLAGVLGKPVAYFLGEAEESPNGERMRSARAYFQQGKYALVLQTLEGYREPDPGSDWEKGLLGYISCLLGAENAAKEGKEPIKIKFLNQSQRFRSPYIIPALTDCREKLASGKKECSEESLDEMLLHRAEEALKSGDPSRAEKLLEAAQQRGEAWFFLRGSAAMAQKDYKTAETCLEQGGQAQCLPLLEECYKAQGNYEKAYFCACKRRESTGG